MRQIGRRNAAGNGRLARKTMLAKIIFRAAPAAGGFD
jgi:hypothetical protein